jgi:hypothetical protein
MPAAVLPILYSAFATMICLGFAGFLLIGIYLMLAHPEYVRNHRSEAIWILVVFFVVGTIFAISFDTVGIPMKPISIPL